MSTSPKKGNAARVATRPRTILLSFLAVVAMVAAVVIGLQVRAGSDGGVGVAHAAPPVTPAARTLAPAPKAPVCGTLSLRDQLAQLLMVGVRNAADARAVVTDAAERYKLDYEIAWLYFNLCRYDEAVRSFETALESDSLAECRLNRKACYDSF